MCVRVYVCLCNYAVYSNLYMWEASSYIHTDKQHIYIYDIYTYIYRVCTLVVDSLGKVSSKLGDSGKHLKLYAEYYLRG